MNHAHPECFASFITNDKTERKCITTSLLDAEASIKPIVRLVAPSTGLVSPETMDNEMTPQERASTVPIKGDRRCAVLNWPVELRPTPKIVIVFSKDNFCRRAQQDAEVELTRNNDLIHMIVTPFCGTQKHIKIKTQDIRIVDKLFATKDDFIDRDSRELLPMNPGDLPASIQVKVAEFWTTVLRAHVLTSACQPCNHTSKRFVSFSRVTISRIGREASTKRLVLKGTLHPSSAECICSLHGVKPLEAHSGKHRFVGSQVEFKISMCGHKLVRPSRDSKFGICPLHQSATPNVSTIPHLCCHNTTCEVSCAHFTNLREFKPGCCIRNIPLDNHGVLYAQTLIAGALDCSEEAVSIARKRKVEEVRDVCALHLQKLDVQLEMVSRLKKHRTSSYDDEAEMKRMDQKAEKMLRERKVRQWRRVSTKQVILVEPKQDGKGVTPLTKPDSELNDHHLWMFKAPTA